LARKPKPSPQTTPRRRPSPAFWVTLGAVVVVILAVSEVAADFAPDMTRLTSGVVKSKSDCGLMAEVLKTSYNLNQVFVVSNKPKVKLACDWAALKLDIQPTPAKLDAEAPVVTIGPPRYAWWRSQATVDVGLKVDDLGAGQACRFTRLFSDWKAKGCRATGRI
jgi:hypothetical protein